MFYGTLFIMINTLIHLFTPVKSNLKMKLTVVKSTTIMFWLATALSAAYAVTLLVSDRPRRPGLIPSIYRGPATYDGGRLRSSASAPYIVVSRQAPNDCGHYHNSHYHQFSHPHYPPSNDEYQYQPFIKPIIESGRQFSYKHKSSLKNKHYAAIKMLSPPHSSYDHQPIHTNNDKKEFNGKWEIIKPVLKADAEGRIVTYNSDGTRVLPEPIYNYHKREMQLLWSPLQKLHRFDDHGQQWKIKEALPRPVNKVNLVKSPQPPPLLSQKMTTHLPILETLDNGIGSSTASQIINVVISTTQATSTARTTVITTPSILTSTSNGVTENNVKNSTTFLDKLSENAKNIFSDIFNNFLSDKKSVKLRMDVENSSSIVVDAYDNSSIQIHDSGNQLSDNNTESKSNNFANVIMPNIVIEANNTESEPKFSDEVDPTSITGWRPLVKPHLTMADDHNYHVPPSSHLMSDFETYDYNNYNDTVDDDQFISADISNVDNLKTTESNDLSEISTKTPRLPSFVSESTANKSKSNMESPIEWLFGQENGLTGHQDSMTNDSKVFDEASYVVEDDKIDRNSETYGNVSTIILIPRSNWTTDNEVAEAVETTTIAVNTNKTAATGNKILNRNEAIDEVKEIYKKVRFGVPFPFNLLHSLVKHL